MTTPLSNYRDIVCLLFRVADPQARFSDMDRLLHKLHDVLSEGESSSRPPFLEPMFVQELLRPPTPPTLVIHPDQKAEAITEAEIVVKPEPSTVRNHVVNLPPSAIHVVKLAEAPAVKSSSASSDVAILAELKKDSGDDEEEDRTTSTPDVGIEEEDEEEACSTDSESEPEVDEEDEEQEDEEQEDEEQEDEEQEDEEQEDEEQEDEEQEDEEEDEDIEEIKIKKATYYWSPSSKRVYEHLEEGYGDCIGTYVDGKITSKGKTVPK